MADIAPTSALSYLKWMDAFIRFATALFASLAESAPYLVVGYLLVALNAIRGSMGNRTAAYYSAALVIVALAGGTITDQFVFANEP